MRCGGLSGPRSRKTRQPTILPRRRRGAAAMGIISLLVALILVAILLRLIA
jgi:hypothetical protein